MNADLAELDDLTEEERNPDWLKDKGEYVLLNTHTHTQTSDDHSTSFSLVLRSEIEEDARLLGFLPEVHFP